MMPKLLGGHPARPAGPYAHNIALTPLGMSYFARLSAGEQLEAVGAARLDESEFESVSEMCAMAARAGKAVAVAVLDPEDARDVYDGRKRLVAISAV